MLYSLQPCQLLTGGLSSCISSSSLVAAVQQQLLPSICSFHTSSSADAATTTASSIQASSRKAAKQASHRALKRLHEIVDSNIQQVPVAARTGDQALLTDAQRESLAIFRRFNISQPQLRGQVILAKVLRSTPKHLLVDSGYYGMNVVPRQVHVVV